MNTIAAKLEGIRDQIAQACASSGRMLDSVDLLAVSKTYGADALAQAYAAGQRSFGENYIQEAVDKMAECTAAGLVGVVWHCIGPIQSNKTRLVAMHFDWVHTLDRLKIAQRLSEQRPEGLGPLQVCVQVNIDASSSKAGVLPEQALGLCLAVAALPNLHLRGLMAIPDPVLRVTASPSEALAATTEVDAHATQALHARVVALHSAIRAQLPQAAQARFDTISLGMSGDMQAAIAAGSTMVRVGSAIFGHRAKGARFP